MAPIVAEAIQFAVSLAGSFGGLVKKVAPPGPMATIWTACASLIAALMFLEVKFLDLMSLRASSKELWAGFACAAIAVSAVSLVAYLLSWQKRTARYDGKLKTIGTNYTVSAENLRTKNESISNEGLLLAATGHEEEIWTQDSLKHSRVILGLEYSALVACLAFGLNLSVEVYNHDWSQHPVVTPSPTFKDLASRMKDAHFSLNRSDVGEDANEKLQDDAATLHAIFVQYTSAHVTIEGFCDDQGTLDYNLRLGYLRAAEVKKRLVRDGVPIDRLQVASFGKESPLCNDAGEECKQKNRRVHLAVTE